MGTTFSVITVVYNGAATIERTLKSVSRQSCQSVEHIVIDGGSTDGTLDILQRYPNVRWVSEPDNGIYNAMNKGLGLAAGDYVQFLGADDCLLNEHILAQVREMLFQQPVDVLSTGIYMVKQRYHMMRYGGNESARKRKQYDGSMIPHPGMFVRTRLMQEYKFNETYRIAADYDLFLRLYLKPEISFRFVNLPTVYFSWEGISASEATRDEHLRAMRENGLSEDLINNVQGQNKQTCYMHIRRMLKEFALTHGLFAGSFEKRGWCRRPEHLWEELE